MSTPKRSKGSKKKAQESYNRSTVSSLSPSNVLAVVASDIHLSKNPPIFRSAEPDWFAAMKRALGEITDLMCMFGIPFIVAGDIFDKWNSPPELINFALDCFPNAYAVPGQHDLPLHNYEDIKKSAYWTLVQSEKITDLHPKENCIHPSKQGVISMRGFPWGIPLRRYKTRTEDIPLAVVHRYCWKPGKSDIPHPSLDENHQKHQHDLGNSGFSVFGDNHIGFVSKGGTLINCGSLMIRNSDQREYRPMVGLLLSKPPRFVPYYLDTSEDVFLESLTKESETVLNGMQEFLDDLGDLASTGVDFVQTVRRLIKKSELSKVARKLIVETLDKVIAKQEKGT